MDPINSIANWLEGLFTGWGLAPWLVNLILTGLGIVVLSTVALIVAIV